MRSCSVEEKYKEVLRASDVSWVTLVPVKKGDHVYRGVTRKHRGERLAARHFMEELCFVSFGTERQFLNVRSAAILVQRLRVLAEALQLKVAANLRTVAESSNAASVRMPSEAVDSLKDLLADALGKFPCIGAGRWK